MRDLHVVLPMAGLGSRFANAGFTTPKPLIPVDGQPMMLKALSSLANIHAVKHFTIIIREEHDRAFNLMKMLQDTLPKANVIVSDEAPIGAIRDAYRAKEFINPDEGIIVLDCDLWFESPEYDAMVEGVLSGSSQLDGGLLTFTSHDPRYSYAEVGPDGLVIRTAEKVVISNNAITGAYFFSSGLQFLWSCEEVLSKPLAEGVPEYYLSNLFNKLLENNAKVGIATVDKFASFGTPEELEAYLKTKGTK